MYYYYKLINTSTKEKLFYCNKTRHLGESFNDFKPDLKFY